MYSAVCGFMFTSSHEIEVTFVLSIDLLR